MAKHNEIGKLGEEIASKFLVNKGFSVIERNYTKKWGEIDIVALLPEHRGETGKVVFVEVKTVSYETKADLKHAVTPAGRTGGHETWRPEEMVHANKLRKLSRAIQTWIAENRCKEPYEVCVVTVRVVPREKYAVVKMIENVIFEGFM